MNSRLDDFDCHILDMVQRNNLTTHRELADHINLSVPAVARRLQKLRSDCVIAKDISVLNPERVGNPLTLIVSVSIENEAVEQLNAITQRFLDCHQVQQCYYVTGDTDFLLMLSVYDMEECQRLTRSLFLDSGNVKRFRTAVSMRRVKVSMAVTLPRTP
ncbi:Lrp/AsnC family transcriptional regulator [Caballeronia sordidicola]|uniref:Transcriptional regulator, AsnC family n=2 Tax=Caballeronia sordidicola TaxID=196367 RepID=A0A242M2W2_CABSO|nr:Lrp/AsnC family transcriptional regulator [Caballeronia sordidicola]OTP65275.1 Transcriptional regulator, AsnC family [Caballeronia sordidicola]